MTDMSCSLPEWQSHAGWSGQCLLGTHGYTPPDPAKLDGVALTEESRADLLARGVQFQGPVGPGNTVWLDRSAARQNLRLRFAGQSANNTIVAAASHALNVTIDIAGRNNLVIFGGGNATVGVTAICRGNGHAVFWGLNTSSNNTSLLLDGPPLSIQIGDEGMFATEVAIRTSDSHGIIDLDQPDAVINRPANCIVEPYVWLQARCTITRGVRVGRGAIVAASALVTTDVPPRTLAAGVPARVLREHVTWTRMLLPNRAGLQRAVELSGDAAQAGPFGATATSIAAV